MIVGNKKDLEENRVVEMTEAAKFAQENGKFIMSNLIRMFICGKFCYDR